MGIKMVLARAVKVFAEKALMRDANNTTCLAIYQPKAPAGLEHFKRNIKKND